MELEDTGGSRVGLGRLGTVPICAPSIRRDTRVKPESGPALNFKLKDIIFTLIQSQGQFIVTVLIIIANFLSRYFHTSKLPKAKE